MDENPFLLSPFAATGLDDRAFLPRHGNAGSLTINPMEPEHHLANLRNYLSDVTAQLRQQHATLQTGWPGGSDVQNEDPIKYLTTEVSDFSTAVVTHNEINQMHGTGILLKRLFPDDSSILHLRSNHLYGDNDFGSRQILIPTRENRFQLYHELVSEIAGVRVKRVLCVPFSSGDLELAIAVSELCEAPLGIYIMDDQNLSNGSITDEVMRKALHRASVRFAISEEMLRAYENRYGQKFYFLPPVVEKTRLKETVGTAESADGVMLGNIWAPEWFESFRTCVREAGIKIDWYGNNSGLALFDEQELREDGINYRGVVSEEDLAERLPHYGFTLLPSEPQPEGSAHWLSRFSLPTRLITCIATGNLPVVVVGAADSAAASFVQAHGLGAICPHEGIALREAVEAILRPEAQDEIRSRAAALAPTLSNCGLQSWFSEAIDGGCPPDNRFETARNIDKGSLAPWIAPRAPAWVAHYEAEIWRVLDQISRLGGTFDFLIDVGASNGIFSLLAANTLSLREAKTRMILVEPFMETYRKQSDYYFGQLPHAEYVVSALSDHSGEMELHVTEELFDSSAFPSMIDGVSEPVIVPMKTLEELASELMLKGRGLLKVDVQGAESLVIEGAGSFLEQIDIVMLETSLVSPDSSMSDFAEIVSMMNDRGFRVFDQSGGWRNPSNGALLQLDTWFIRHDCSWPSTHETQPNAGQRS